MTLGRGGDYAWEGSRVAPAAAMQVVAGYVMITQKESPAFDDK